MSDHDPTQMMPNVPPGPVGSGAPGAGPPAAGGQPPRRPVGPSQPWYRQPLPVAAVSLGVVLVIALVALVAVIVTDDDGDTEQIVATSTIVEDPSTTSEATTTTMESTTTTIEQTTTVPETTTTLDETTTSSTTSTTAATTTTSTTAATSTTATPTTAPPDPPEITVPPGGRTTFSVSDVLFGSPDVSEFADALVATGLDEWLDAAEDVTVLVPSNDAFEAANPLVLAGIRSDPDAYERFVSGHLVEQRLTAAEILELNELMALSGVVHEVDPVAETVAGVQFVVVDVEASNGIIHVLDAVIVDE